MRLYPFSGRTTSAVLLASRAIDPTLPGIERFQAAQELALLVMGTYDDMNDADRKQIDRSIELRLHHMSRH